MGVVYRQGRSKTKISTKITALCKKFFALDHTFEICLLQENNIDLTFSLFICNIYRRHLWTTYRHSPVIKTA